MYSLLLRRPKEEQAIAAEQTSYSVELIPYQEQITRLIEEKKIDAAFEYLDESVRTKPNLAVDLSLLTAAIAKEQGNYEKMQEAYQKVRELDSSRLPPSQQSFIQLDVSP